MKWNRANFV